MFDSLSLGKELVGGGLDGGDGELVIHVQTLDDFELTVGGGNWE